MSPIKDYAVYTNGMKRAMYDKLFFVDKIKPSMIVDFGCADGQLLNELRPYYPDALMFGVDNDSVMRDEAKDNFGLDVRASLEDIEPYEKGSALILSSVLHELYSYSTVNEILDFWKLARRFEYIVIRDMALPRSAISTCVSAGEAQMIRELLPSQVADFTDVWGGIQTTENFLHFLLKYKYVENWKREVQENYLPNTMETLVNKASIDAEVVYQDHRVLPYLKEQWNKDFGVRVETPTHLKLITRRI